MVWNLLQISDVLDIEFGSALAERVPLTAWKPYRHLLPNPFSRRFALSATQELISDPPLRIRSFPLQRGYARFPISLVSRTGATVAAHIQQHTRNAQTSPLICTVPYFAPVAEHWPGPVVYWLTDRIEGYGGVDAEAIHRLDRRMCHRAKLVFPNSARLASYLEREAHCDPAKIRILPNATRASNLLFSPPSKPLSLPTEIADVPRPIAGVIGNLAGNMDWLLIEQSMLISPWLNWVFVGPTTMDISDAEQRLARARVMQLPKARFIGKKVYGELAAFARCFDVAILPYRLCEPTYSGSSTRFYEHLAACRPMIATRGFEELLHKEPLLHLADTAEQILRKLHELRSTDFDDGLAEKRWEASQVGTWQTRAATMEDELALALRTRTTSSEFAACRAKIR